VTADVLAHGRGETTERERADVIQQLALARIEALTATTGDQREDASLDAPEAPGSTEGDRVRVLSLPAVGANVEEDERGKLEEGQRVDPPGLAVVGG